MLSSSIERAAPDTTVRNRFYPLKVASVKPDTKDAGVVVFSVPPELRDTFRFVQGQFVTLRARIGGQDVQRSYSICSAVQDGLLRVGIKKTPGGVFSTWAVETLKPGSIVEVMPPEGRFHVTLSPQQVNHYVAFAVGSGVTPVLSIIKTTLFTEPNSHFTLFYGNRASTTVMFREELAELKDMFLDRFSLIHVLTREHQDIDLLNGRITGDRAALLLNAFCRPQDVDYVFLCGPLQMVDDVVPKLEQLGIPESHIKIELFTPASLEGQAAVKPATASAAEECQITILADGTVHSFPLEKETETILDAALNRGIDLPHSCKSGVCATCRAKLIEGQVQMAANYALDDEEIARGFILTCQSYPLTPEVKVDFDQYN